MKPAFARAAGLLLPWAVLPLAAAVTVSSGPRLEPRERYAVERLSAAVKGLPGGGRIVVGRAGSALLQPCNLPAFEDGAAEAFRLKRAGELWLVAGSGSSGVLDASTRATASRSSSGTIPTSGS